MADAPEVRERRVIPERFAERCFIERADAVGRVLCRDVERDFRKVEIRPDAARRRQAEAALDFAEQEARHFARRPVVHRRVAGNVDKRFIDGVDKNILFAEIVEVDAVDFGSVVQIQLHPGRRHDVTEARGNLEDAAAVAHALRFQRRRHGETYRSAPARRIRDHEIGRHRIKPAHHALARGVE